MAIKENEVVAMEYQVVDANSQEVIDSNMGMDPLEFIVGKGHIIPGLENKIMELSNGDKADIMVNPAEAYGEYNTEALDTLAREQFSGIELKEGMTLYGTGESGQTVQVRVKSFDDSNVTIDYNHPLAGKTLMFTITIMDVRAATEEEIASGIVGGFSAGGCCGGGSCGSHSHDHEEKDECCGAHTGDKAGGCCNSH
jgi:FKBP-type peptidyl-prolyl cis-trans isomerase SlyD